MSNYKDKKVIVRCNRAGVFFGTLSEFDKVNRIATISNCRRLWYWNGAASLSQLAMEGSKNPQKCKFTMTVPEMEVLDVIETIPCTETAIKSIEEVPVWKI